MPQIWIVGRVSLPTVYFYVLVHGPHALQYEEVDEKIDFRPN